MESIQNLLNSLGNNIRSIAYDVYIGQWVITYKDGLNNDYVNTEDLEFHLNNV